jgi:RND family efflux transporter MFP subunit
MELSQGRIFGIAVFMLFALLPASAIADANSKISDCFIEPSRVAEVSSSILGVVDEIVVKRGDTVKMDQALMTLESRIETATIKLARARAERNQAMKARTARVDFTRRQFERNKELFSRNLISEQVVDEARTEALLAEIELGGILEERTIAELELERAVEALAIRTIRSPFDGVVVEITVAEGESIENRSLMKIARIDPLNVEIIAPIQAFGKIKAGMEAMIVPEDPIGGQYTARVVIVDRVIDASSGTFGVRLQLPNKKFELPAGLRCTVDFIEI